MESQNMKTAAWQDRVELKRHLNQSKTCEHSPPTHFTISEKHPPAAMGVPFGGTRDKVWGSRQSVMVTKGLHCSTPVHSNMLPHYHPAAPVDHTVFCETQVYYV
ncbi:hypothetical protein OPV22_014921 [Ensete ventricosum]|uniref:Uncharacterized protein n=1 Tax=Ensete ventricosum TaxID=4639 RepID=A0AAV8R2N4_ENSVE|nr:hypothetical protein OPV22_014921 [Ensete ventricosum]